MNAVNSARSRSKCPPSKIFNKISDCRSGGVTCLNLAMNFTGSQ